jgi:formylglycine-generating enzyme required for sulfatase activity
MKISSRKIAGLLTMIILLARCTPISEATLYKRIVKHLPWYSPKEPTINFNIPADFDVTPKSSIKWIYIKSGEFIMGSSDSDVERADDEIHQHRVYLDAFWISKTEITNTMYKNCVDAGVCKYSVSFVTNSNYLDPVYANHPVVYINWRGAQTFCNWIGGRLPTEAEWEKAARGPDGEQYPWDSSVDALIFTNSDNMVGDTTPVNAFPNSVSYYGVLDMNGNVREWVYDWYDPDYYKNSPYNNPQGPEKTGLKVLKGASYLDSLRYTRAANRLAHKPNSPGATRGFRCAMSIGGNL